MTWPHVFLQKNGQRSAKLSPGGPPEDGVLILASSLTLSSDMHSI